MSTNLVTCFPQKSAENQNNNCATCSHFHKCSLQIKLSVCYIVQLIVFFSALPKDIKESGNNGKVKLMKGI